MKYGLLLAFLPFSLLTIFLPSQHAKVSTAGDQNIYTWQSTSTGYSDIQQLYQADTVAAKTSFFNRKTLQSLQVSIHCGIKKTIISTDSRAKLVCFQITDPAVAVEQAGQTVNSDIIKKELMHPVLVEMSHRGLMKIIRIDTAISNLSANMIKGMLSRLQFVNSTKNENEWQIIEENTAGVYLAKYRKVKSQATRFEFEKMNAGYTSLKYSRQNQRIMDNGKITISTDTSGTVVSISANDGQVVLFNADTVALSATKVSVLLESTTKASDKELASLASLTRTPNYNDRSTLSAALSEDKINRLAYTKTLSSDNLESLTKLLNQQDEKKEENLILKFRALAYLYPRSCENLGLLLKKAPVGSYTFSVLSNALANAETEAAINALVKVIEARKGEEETVIALLPVLATTKTPTENAVIIGKELAFSPTSTTDIASTAQLALGGLAYNFTKSDKKKSEQITQFLLDKLRTETDTIQKVMALANTGSILVLPVLKNYLTHPHISVEVRTAAISGLRLMEDSSSVNLLNSMVYHQDSAIVKKAKEVIDFRKEFFQNR